MTRSIAHVATKGLAWTTGLSLLGRAATLISQLILAKLLMPQDFGVVGLAYTIVNVFGIVNGFGIDQVLQQRRRMHLWATQAFILSLGISLVVAAAMSLYAPIAAKMYHNAAINRIIWIIATSFPFTALCTVPQARLKSTLRFKFIALYSSIELLVTQTLIVILAWFGFGVLSFVLPLPIAAVIRAAVFWKTAPIILQARLPLRGWAHLTVRSMSMLGIAILNTVIGQGDYIVLGLTAPAYVVGLYYFAFRLVAQPMTLLASNFTSVLRPSLIAMAGERERQRNAAMRTAEMLALITIPTCFLQAAVSKPLLSAFFGHRWDGAIPIVEILSIGIPIDAASWAAGALIEARGEYSKSLRYQLITAPFFFLFVLTGAHYGSGTGVALGVTAYYFLHPIFLTTLVFRREGVELRRIFSCFSLPLAVGIPSVGCAWAIGQLDGFQTQPLVQSVIVIVLGGGLYVIGVRQCSRKTYDDLRNRMLQMFSKPRVPA